MCRERHEVCIETPRGTAATGSSIARMAQARLPSNTMLLSRAQPAMSRSPRRALAWLLALCSLLSLLLLGTAAQAHGHGHRHVPTTHAKAAPDAHSHESASDEVSPDDDEHGHRHSGDPLKDLLTLGHNHVGGGCPGLPPTPWVLAAAPHATQPVVAWPERTLGDSPPDNPFRPPIV